MVTDDVAKRLLAERPSADGAVLVVAGDRVTEAARNVLISARAGYLDLRGRWAVRAAGLVIDTDVAPVKARAHRWPAQRVFLATLPADDDASLARPLRLGLDDVDRKPGWALTDSAAATAYGAGVAAGSDQVLDFFVPDESVVRRATTRLGTAASGSQARATVRVAPVPAVVAQRVRSESAPWPLAHPLFVALDLAQDVGRGREILDAWTPDGWARVW